ncbi:hypothetical protein [Hymenobacter sp. BT190]|uniref:hypothetical protein n=1 Tax=Hymenobacter sp. BT190 TaxID=2763505 RepID=UPI001651699A|nr:hypothetical protein [Hymenobacter sp. BT190]MBC6698699.1 hypothetical protein [Hymenobacter sp. BT190]
MKRQLTEFDLATTIDEILPYGCIMAGDWEQDAPWRKRKHVEEAARLAADDTQADGSALAE